MSAGGRRFCVIHCEESAKWDFVNEAFAALFAEDGETWEVFRAYAGELPPVDDDSIAAITITGSNNNASDDVAWVKQLAAWIRDFHSAANTTTRLFGSCFGHQIIAAALGGEAGRNPAGQLVYNAETLELSGDAARMLREAQQHSAAIRVPPISPGGANLSGYRVAEVRTDHDCDAPVLAIECHGDCALRLPPGARRLASSPSCENEMYVLGTRILCLQSHPEMRYDELVAAIRPALRASGKVTDEMEAAATPSLDALRRHSASDGRCYRLLRLVRAFLKGAVTPACD